MSGVIIDGGPLDVSGVVKFGLGDEKVSISNDVRTIIATSRTIVDSFIRSDTAVYGLTTALGSNMPFFTTMVTNNF
jgi:histidine ammonia-lyase